MSRKVEHIMDLILDLSLREIAELRQELRRLLGEDEGGAGVREPRRPVRPIGGREQEEELPL